MINTQVKHGRGWNVPSGRTCSVPVVAVARCLVLIAVVTGVLALTGCGDPKTSDRDLILMNVDDARELFARGRGGLRIGRSGQAAWIDPRSESEFRAERIPGAIHLPLDRVRDDHRPLREYDVLIVYGDDFNSPRAAALSKTLIELGHGDVRTLRGGLRAWKAAGHSVESGSE